MRVRFPNHVLDLDAGMLSRGDQPVRLQPKTFALLTLLVRSAGRLVSHEEVRAALWPDVRVTADSVSQVVRKLRRALGDNARDPRFVKTVPARGLRWIGGSVADDGVVPPTAATGRTAEQAQAMRWLASDRVVALVGPGGIGKTWLARSIREGAACSCTAVLTEARTVEDVAMITAQAAGVPVAAAARTTLDRVGAAFAARGGMVLLLDGAEHVAVAPIVTVWLARDPGLRIVITSRVREPALPTVALAGLDDSRGAALLARLSGRADAELASLSAALDGSPLALELAARRLRTMTAGEVLARLDQRFAMLREPSGGGLEAVLQTAWQELGPDDQQALEGLAVVRGPFSMRVAEAVLPDRFVPDVVTRLRDRSWLEVVRGAPSLVRLSATVRAFATLRGTETHRGAVRAALADWVATEDTVDQDRSLDLVRGLLEHGVELRPAVRARLAGMAAQALRIGGALVTALALVKDAMDRGVGGVEGAKIRRIYGELLGVTGSPADALTHLGLLLEQTSDDAERTSLQLARGVVLRHLGRLPEARAAARDAVDHAGAHTLLRGSALHALAVTDESVARELYSEVVTLAERHGEPRLAALARFNQAVWLQDRGRLPEAEVRYADVLADRAVEPLLRITGQRNLAALRSTRGDEAGARHLIDRAIGLARAAGRRRLEASCELVRADIELHAGNLQECDVRCRELLRTAPTQDTETLAQTRLVRGAAAWCAGRAAEAVAWFDEAIERADRSASPRSAALGRVLRVCAGAGDLAGVTPAVAALDDPQLTALFDVARGLEAARAGRHHDAADIAARLRAGPAETYRDLHWALPQLEAQVAKTT